MPPGYWSQVIDSTGYPRFYKNDPRVDPVGYEFKFEVIPGQATPTVVADRFCLITDYEDSTDNPIHINYIRLVTDDTIWTYTFKECVICKLRVLLAIPICESIQKKQDAEKDLARALISAGAFNESLDSVLDEVGSSSWENAGR